MRIITVKHYEDAQNLLQGLFYKQQIAIITTVDWVWIQCRMVLWIYMKHYNFLAIPWNFPYWMTQYSHNSTKKDMWCTVKSCDAAGLWFLIFDFYFAHTTLQLTKAHIYFFDFCVDFAQTCWVFGLFSKQIFIGLLPNMDSSG